MSTTTELTDSPTNIPDDVVRRMHANHVRITGAESTTTPRTDAEIEYDPTTIDDVKNFARKLERELSSAKSALEKARDVIGDVASMNAQGGLIGRITVASAKEALTAIDEVLGGGDSEAESKGLPQAHS